MNIPESVVNQFGLYFMHKIEYQIKRRMPDCKIIGDKMCYNFCFVSKVSQLVTSKPQSL